MCLEKGTFGNWTQREINHTDDGRRKLPRTRSKQCRRRRRKSNHACLFSGDVFLEIKTKSPRPMLERSHAHHHAMHCPHTSAFYFYACDTRVYVCAFVRVCGAFAWSFSYEAAYCPHLPVVVLHFFFCIMFCSALRIAKRRSSNTTHPKHTRLTIGDSSVCVRSPCAAVKFRETVFTSLPGTVVRNWKISFSRKLASLFASVTISSPKLFQSRCFLTQHCSSYEFTSL